MGHYKLALLGFGNVGRALARLLLSKENDIRDDYGITFSVTGIATGKHGSMINMAGINLRKALEVMETGDDVGGSTLNQLSTEPAPVDSFDFIQRCGADVLFENTPVNYKSGQPAIEHIRQALGMGMHAITANKGPVVYAYRELSDLAEHNEVKFYFESAVMDGAPIFSLFRDTLPSARVISFRGVLNSTTNMILTRMEQGYSFDESVAYTQRIGIAETDPSGDIDGWDAAIKVAALVTVLMGVPLKPWEVNRTGIRQITETDIQDALDSGKRWKLVCSSRIKDGDVQTQVAPGLVGQESAIYRVAGTTSIVEFETDVLGKLSILEENPGPHTTAYGCLADFLNAVWR